MPQRMLFECHKCLRFKGPLTLALALAPTLVPPSPSAGSAFSRSACAPSPPPPPSNLLQFQVGFCALCLCNFSPHAAKVYKLKLCKTRSAPLKILLRIRHVGAQAALIACMLHVARCRCTLPAACCTLHTCRRRMSQKLCIATMRTDCAGDHEAAVTSIKFSYTFFISK